MMSTKPLKTLASFYKKDFLFSALRNTLFKMDTYHNALLYFHRLKNDFETDKYEHKLDPYKTVWVDVSEVERISFRNCDSYSWGKIKSGDWDLKGPEDVDNIDSNKFPTKYFKDYYIDRSFVDHFEEGLAWEDTDLYTIVRDEIKDHGKFWHGCQNMDDIYKRLEYCDDLYKKIDKNGYKSQRVLHNSSFKTTIRNEILIDIDRNGEFLFKDGRHRLSICKILDVGKVPMKIACRHKKWMEKREEILSGENPTNHVDIYMDN